MAMSMAEIGEFKRLKEAVEALREGLHLALERLEKLETEAVSGKARKNSK